MLIFGSRTANKNDAFYLILFFLNFLAIKFLNCSLHTNFQ
ncbi:hypothetical protein MTsPCn6_21590 [Croceitalea sp. MTPC6]|nr:hypothetical protein MTsPCn6_21590 [Croceitalea sp. MTPC6]